MADVLTGTLSWRRFRDLLANMPGDGTALWRKHRRAYRPGTKGSPPPPDWWTPERDQLARIGDGIDVLVWQQTKGGRQGHGQPTPTRRPGVGDDKTFGTTHTAAEILAILRPEAEPEG